jgi:hypothetical protein
MIHPSTMAGPNWFSANLGTTNPFQQSTTPFFRTSPYQGSQGGYGLGNTPFQTQPFAWGTNTMQMQMQNTINEIVRQTVPRVLASCGIQTSASFQTPFGFQSPGGPGPFGQQFQASPWTSQIPIYNQPPNLGDWQSQIALQELIRQTTNQAIQHVTQQNPSLLAQWSQGPYGLNWQQQQQLQQQQQQNLWNLVGQVCQAVTASVIDCLTQSNSMQGTSFNIGAGQFSGQQPYFTQQPMFGQQPPLNLGSTQPQYGVTSGIPTGTGAF